MSGVKEPRYDKREEQSACDSPSSFDKFKAVSPWIAHEESLLPWKSIARDYFHPRRFKSISKRFKIGDAEGGVATRLLVDNRRVLFGGQMQLLDAALVPCSGITAVGIGGTLERFEAEQFLVECARPRERVVAAIDQKVYVIESDNQAHRPFLSLDRPSVLTMPMAVDPSASASGGVR
jgi:hypothetical protein